MRKMMMSVMALFAFGAAADAAQAQEASGTKWELRAARDLQLIGQCLAADRPEWAQEYVVIDYRSDRYHSLGKKLRERAERCDNFRRGIRPSGLIFAGALAEGLLREEGLLEALPAHVAYRADLPSVEARSGEDVFGYCVVRKQPDLVAELLGTETMSDEEMTSLKALAPILPTCVPQGQETKFTRESLRALFALSAYRLHAHNHQAAAPAAQ